MPSYPTIDYLGAAQGIIRNIDDFERLKIARAAEESNSQYRDLLGQQLRDEMQQKQKLREAQAGFPAYLAQNQHLLFPGVGERQVEDLSSPITGVPEEPPAMKVENFMTPAKETTHSMLSKYYNEKGFPDVAEKYSASEDVRKEKMVGHKMTFAAKILGDAMKAGGDVPDQLMKNLQDDPDIGYMFKGVKSFKMTPKGFEAEAEREVKEGEFKFPGTNDPVPAGKYDIKTITDSTGNTVIKKIKPVEDKAPTRHSGGYGIDEEWNPKTKEWVARRVPVNPAGDMTDLNRQVKEQGLLLSKEAASRSAREAEEKNVKEEAGLVNDPKSYENAGYKVVGGEKMKKDALDRRNMLRKNAGLPELEQVPKTVPDESNKNWTGDKIWKQPTKTIYEWVPKKTPLSGQKTSVLSNLPDDQLFSLAKSRGLA